MAGIRTPPPGGGHVLDFGCGNGRWLDTMAGFGWETFGIDPALKTAFTRHTELAAIPAAAQFHFVIVSHVLEHVTNPGSLLKALAAATRPGGWISSVPDLDRLPEHGDWHYVLNARAHLAAYSVDCLTTLLGRAGFGRAQVVRLPREEGHSGKRLRMVAQRSAPVASVPDPLAAAIRALAGYQTAAATDGDAAGGRISWRRSSRRSRCRRSRLDSPGCSPWTRAPNSRKWRWRRRPAGRGARPWHCRWRRS